MIWGGGVVEWRAELFHIILKEGGLFLSRGTTERRHVCLGIVALPPDANGGVRYDDVVAMADGRRMDGLSESGKGV